MNRYDEFAEILRHWSPPVELTRSIPREARLTRGGVAVMVLAFVLFGGGIALAVFLGSRAVADGRRLAAIEEQGYDADAVITRLWHTGGKDELYHVAYTFEWRGQTYRHQQNVPRRTWATLTQGDSLPIRFVPSHPEWSHARAWKDRPLPPAMPGFVGVGMAVPAILILLMVRRQKRLIEEGRPAPAVVLKRKRVHHSHGGGQTIVSYEFPLPGGSIAKGRASAPRRGGDVGSVLCAIYLPENPRRNALYPLDLARPGE